MWVPFVTTRPLHALYVWKWCTANEDRTELFAAPNHPILPWCDFLIFAVTADLVVDGIGVCIFTPYHVVASVNA